MGAPIGQGEAAARLIWLESQTQQGKVAPPTQFTFITALGIGTALVTVSR
ncbi:MAG: hypothetical protein R2867_06450 [Caldilineaceae bacterium]